MKLTIAALVLAGAFWGCASPDSADDGMGGAGGAMAGGGGTGSAGATGTGGTTGVAGDGAGGGQSGAGGALAMAGRGGSGGGTAGASGGPGVGGTTGAGGSGTGGSSAAPPTCDSLGWTPGEASLCGASKGAYACASCSLPGPPLGGTQPDCLSSSAAQHGMVLCTDCSGCR